ncbi:MAG: hypothetical protein Aurels2KO_37250 [Aureliella sp.]
MNCEAFENSVVQYYLGELDSELSAKFDDHLAGGCPDCRRGLAEVIDGIDVLYESAPSRALSDSKRSAILDRVEQHVSRESNAPVAKSYSARKPLSAVGATTAGACSIAAGWLLAMTLFPVTHKDAEQSERQVSQADDSLKMPAGTLADAEPIPSELRMADDEFRTTKFVSLRYSAKPFGPSGKIIWDPLAGEVHFFGSGFLRPSEGEQVVLWVEDRLEERLRSISLEINDLGQCRAVVPASTLVPPRVFATAESASAIADKPSGEMLLEQEG